jgi:hypothetical protein
MLLLTRRCCGDESEVSTFGGDSSDFFEFEEADRSLDGVRRGLNRLFHEIEGADAIPVVAALATMGTRATARLDAGGNYCTVRGRDSLTTLANSIMMCIQSCILKSSLKKEKLLTNYMRQFEFI